MSTTPASQLRPSHFYVRVLVKGLLLFLVINLLCAAWQPSQSLGRLSAYNHIFPGRLRLPYSDHPERAYSLSLNNLEAMFATHQLAANPKAPDEYRVLLIGDSSTWGFLLPAGQTLAAQINTAGYALPDGRRVHAYNLGYPVMSLTKDLLLLSYGMRYQPDLIVWPLTLESFPYDKQLFPPLLQNNPEAVSELIETYQLKVPLPEGKQPRKLATFWDATLIGQRRSLADLLRLQLYGVLWAATGIDQDIPATYTPRQEDLPADLEFHDLQPPHLSRDELAFDVLQAGVKMAGKTPVLFINEPMFVSHGQNSDLRYNFFYPRWAYDDYHRLLADESTAQGWQYRDLWQAADNQEFTNSAVHLTPNGTAQLAKKVGEAILQVATGQPEPDQSVEERP